MFSAKSSKVNKKGKISFRDYITKEQKLDLPEEVLSYIEKTFEVKTIEDLANNYIPT